MSEAVLARVRESDVDLGHQLMLVVFAPGLFLRELAASVVWAIVYNRKGAVLSLSPLDEPLDSPDWHLLDEVQTSIMSIGVMGFFWSLQDEYIGGAVVTGYLIVNAAVAANVGGLLSASELH